MAVGTVDERFDWLLANVGSVVLASWVSKFGRRTKVLGTLSHVSGLVVEPCEDGLCAHVLIGGESYAVPLESDTLSMSQWFAPRSTLPAYPAEMAT